MRTFIRIFNDYAFFILIAASLLVVSLQSRAKESDCTKHLKEPTVWQLDTSYSSDELLAYMNIDDQGYVMKEYCGNMLTGFLEKSTCCVYNDISSENND